jgi:uncharacterized protein DUF3465
MVRKALIVLAIGLVGWQAWLRSPQHGAAERTAAFDVPSAFQPGSHLTAKAVVERVLADDNSGSRHQRFIVRLGSGQTLLIAHNIDIAPRVEGLAPGDTITFSGIYETNDKGGVVHWTHRDPSGRHAAGWIELRGHRYQ